MVPVLMRVKIPRGLCFRPVSVPLSGTLVHCIQTAKDIVKPLPRPGSPIILVFLLPAPVPNSKENPFSEEAKYKRWENFAFSTEIAAYLGNGTR